MNLNVNDEIKNICEQIVDEDKTIEEWATVESGDI
jgi:hypothetical protein